MTTWAEMGAAVDRVPARFRQHGRFLVCEVELPGVRNRAGRPVVVRRAVDMRRVHHAGYEMGWFGSKAVRKAKRSVRSVAKKIAKNKALRALAKTAPIWANIIPPPAGQTIAAGAAAAMAAAKIAKAAKGGHKRAKAFIAKAKGKKRAAKRDVRKLADVAKAARRKGLPVATVRKVVRRAAERSVNRRGEYIVRTPSGRSVRVPASKVLV